jgi:hypothetical protein
MPTNSSKLDYLSAKARHIKHWRAGTLMARKYNRKILTPAPKGARRSEAPPRTTHGNKRAFDMRPKPTDARRYDVFKSDRRLDPQPGEVEKGGGED